MLNDKLLRPRALRKGDCIGIVAPSSNLKEELLLEGVTELEHLGFRVKYSSSILDHWRYLSGSDKRRSDELNSMFADPEVNGIFCARGGYGAIRLLPLLNIEVIRENPKVLLGYSDITTLLLFLSYTCGIVSFHGPMVTWEFAMGRDYYDYQSLWDALSGEKPDWTITSDKVEILREGNATGRLTGGCLSLIVSSLGTPYEINTEDTVLFLEDISTKPYQIDRMILQLRYAGKFDKIRGIVFGEMVDCLQHPDQGYTLQEVVLDVLSDLNVPIFYGFPSGHTSFGCLTIPFGVRIFMESRTKTLTVLEPAVESHNI